MKKIILKEVKACTSGYHSKKNSRYPKDRVPIELFYKYENDPNGPILKTCLDCRNFSAKSIKTSEENKERFSEDKEKIFEDVFLVCNSKNHDKPCVSSQYPKNKVPKFLFQKYPGQVESPLYRNCLNCRTYSNTKNKERINRIKDEEKEKMKHVIQDEIENEQDEIENEQDEIENEQDETETKNEQDEDSDFMYCNSGIHYYKQTKTYKENVPKHLFQKDPKDPSKGYYKSCVLCRERSNQIKRSALERKKDIRNENLENGEKFITCLNLCHDSRGSIYEKDKVPVSEFLKDPEDPKSELRDSCRTCREFGQELRLNLREERKEIAKQTGQFFCTKGHLTDKLALKKNGEPGKLCPECKEESELRNSITRKIIENIKYEFIIKYNSSCQNCNSIFLKPEESKFYCRELKTFDLNGERFLQYEKITYKVQDFIIQFKDLLEIRIIEFDHLQENEQRERGLLKDDDEFIPKKALVNKLGSESEIRKEVAKCQHLCAKCHVKVTMSRDITTNRYINDKKEYVNELKSKGCEVCGYQDIELLRFFELDHIDPKTKIDKLARMTIKNNYNLEDVVKECEKCRVLCRHCHTIHSDFQRKMGIIHNYI